MKLINIKKCFNQVRKNKSFRYGMPFILFCICSSFGLKQFMDIRYKYKNAKTIREAAAEKGIKLNKIEDLTLEAQYEKIKQLDIDNWSNIRIPRPWE